MLILQSRKVPTTIKEAIDAVESARWPPLLERELWAEACVRDYWSYLLYGFGVLAYLGKNPGEDWLQREDDSIHRKLAVWLQQQLIEWEDTRLTRRTPIWTFELMPRGTAKSITVTCGFSSWSHLRNPNLASFIDSYKLSISQDFLGTIQRVWGGAASESWFVPLYGSWEPPSGDVRAWNKLTCTHMGRQVLGRRDPSFECVSVETGLTSHHPDMIHMDDLVVREKLLEEGTAWLDKVDRHMGDVPYCLLKNGFATFAMTRYLDNDPAGRCMREEGVSEFADTGQLPNARDYSLRPDGKWRVFYAAGLDRQGRAVFDMIWPRERIEQEEQVRPEYVASQVLLDPMAGGHHPVQPGHVQRAWFQLGRGEEKGDIGIKSLRLSFHWDTAFDPQRRDKGDETVILLAGQPQEGDGKMLYLEARGSRKWSETDAANEFAEWLIELDKEGLWPWVYTDEQSPGKAGLFGAFIKTHLWSKYRILPPRFEEIPRGGGPKKEARISYAAGFWQSGHVGLARGGPGLHMLVNQMLAFPGQYLGHDDYADPAADAFHPKIYKPSRVKTGSKGPDAQDRPFDQVLRMPQRYRTDSEADRVYAEMAKREKRHMRPRVLRVLRGGSGGWRQS